MSLWPVKFKASVGTLYLTQHRKEIEEVIGSTDTSVSILSLLSEAKTSWSLSYSIFELSPEDDLRLLSGARI